MLELIPQEYYFRAEADPNQWKSKFSKNTRKSKSKQLAAHKQNKRAETRQQKKSKFDTAQAPSLQEKQRQRALEAQKSSTTARHSLHDPDGKVLPPTERADSLDALRERMRVKIQLLKAGRSTTGRPRPRRDPAQRPPRKRPQQENDDDGDESEIAASMGSAVDQIDFNSFVSLTSDKKDNGQPPRKKASLRSLVRQADEKAQRIQDLKNSGEDPEFVAKEAWKTVLLKAKGEKPTDDVKYLKKKLKEKQKKKVKSAKEWKIRNKSVEKAKADRQAQRQYNIDNRGVPKVDRIDPVTGEPLIAPRPTAADDDDAGNGGSNRHSGRSRPGFEGRARGFLNKPSGKAAGGRR